MKTYDVFLCHSTRHDADTATENTMAMVYVLLKDQLGSRPRGQARRGGLARAYVAAGRKPEAAALLDGLMKRSTALHSYASEIAVIYAAIGESDHAMTW